MRRSDQPGPVPEEVRKFIRDTDMPTTPEIAREGVRHFEAIVRGLPPGRTRNLMLWERSIRTAFTGISPQLATRHPYTIEMGRFREEMESTSRDFMTLHDIPGGNYPLVCFLNLKAGERVVRNNPDIFPEAQADPVTWLKTESETFIYSSDMLGLLSGYAEWNVVGFRHLYNAWRKLEDDISVIIDPEEYELHRDYISGGVPRTLDVREKMAAIYRKANPDITEIELTTLLAAKTYSIEGGHPFFGFDEEKDKEYVAALSKIHTESGIDEVAERLEDEFSGR